ncbi:Hsp20/alpha crystallin family protein [Parvularcula lutaonensis]|uniref:Hsp20/alpha crystallin family protein n=1 Tax=Parvularcula lutaonensis TaxID=491923 RepID=A0ABV7MAN1_9PROT|nr:Hsp20/alpha crystallin family protein [Parvularcula lutaonensis]GGY38411.1 heat-shock protein Hsp20 [Parvularcula lutaonensis]
MMLSSFDPSRNWDPFTEMRWLQNQMNQFFESVADRSSSAFPAVNLYANDQGLLITAEMPGFSEDQVELSVQDNELVIEGETSETNEATDWHRKERRYGKFVRRIELPFRVDPDQVDARFENGVLEIELKRPEEDKPRKIPVNR